MKIEIKMIEMFPLDKVMREKKISDRKLAELTGVHYTHISRLRNERSMASVATAKKIFKALGVKQKKYELFNDGTINEEV